MRKQRRELQEASISFLDVISCGFGAIVLLLVIAKVGDPSALEDAEKKLLGSVKSYQERLFEIRGESVILDQRLQSRKQQLSELSERVARLKEKLASVAKQSNQLGQSQVREKDQLNLALQVLSEEMERLLGSRSQQNNGLIAGIPVDSEYIIFVVDTSGSMSESRIWERLKGEFVNILNNHPTVKGIQIINTDAKYLMTTTKGNWITDSPEMRERILSRFDDWKLTSMLSSPTKAVPFAIETFYKPGRNISIYTFFDDFSDGGGGGTSIRRVIKGIADINKSNKGQGGLVRIHNIGLSHTLFSQKSKYQQAVRFANLLRELSYNNGGTFVGLNTLQ
jgi:hypothetical protein